MCAAITLDSIWNLQNEVVHSNVHSDLQGLIFTIRRRFGEHLAAWAKVSLASGSVWIPHPLGIFKCNIDVAMRPTHSVLAVVLRDHESSLCTLYTECVPH